MSNTKYEFSPFFATQILNGFTSSFESLPDSKWTRGKNYAIGDVVISSNIHNNTVINNKYIATTIGTAGIKPPIHTNKGEVKTDGGVKWMFVETKTITDTNNLYVTFGKKDQWEDDNNPPQPVLLPEKMDEHTANIIYAKRVDNSAVSLVVPRNTWKENTVYDEYHSTSENYTHPHYATNNQGQIYYCLYNNSSSPSQIEPVGESSQPINLMDGYVWLYVGKLNISNSTFLTEDYIPVGTDLSFSPFLNQNHRGISAVDLNTKQVGKFQDTDELEIKIISTSGSGAELTAIKNNQGVITDIEISKTGIGYREDTYIIIQKKDIQGKAGQGTAVIENGELKSITITNPGFGYVQGQTTVVIKGDGVDATAEATVSTAGNISGVTITNAGSGYTKADIYIIPGSAGMVCDTRILPHSTDYVDLLASLGKASLMIAVEVKAGSKYFPVDTDYRQVGLVINLQDKSTTQLSKKDEYIGFSHSQWEDFDVKLNKIQKEKGYFLFLQNNPKYTHVSNQTEVIKIVFDW